MVVPDRPLCWESNVARKGQFREHISSRGDDLFKPDLRSFIGARGKYPISDRSSAQRAWAFGQFADFQTERCKLVGELL